MLDTAPSYGGSESVLASILEELGIRYVGVTTSSDRQYERLEGVMRDEELDLVQVDYSLATGARRSGSCRWPETTAWPR